MRVGADWPYDALPQAPDVTWEVFRHLNPDSVVIMSHAAQADYERLLAEFPLIEFTIRAKMGPAHLGYGPSDILNYREWPSERSLGDSLELLASAGKTLRAIKWNEPDIELAREPVDDFTNLNEAIDNYIESWWREVQAIRAAFPGVQLAPAPISQGNRDRWLKWASAMNGVYRDADFIVEHCYIPIGGDSADWGERYKWYRLAYPDKPLIIGEVNDDGQYGVFTAAERALRYAIYIEQVAATGEVDEVDVFTLPGGAQDANAPAWWFITPEMAYVIAAADRNPEIDSIEEETTVPEFELGFKDKADELGADIVGEPLEDQDYLPLATGGEIAFQTTSTGLMVYSKAANKVHFIPGR